MQRSKHRLLIAPYVCGTSIETHIANTFTSFEIANEKGSKWTQTGVALIHTKNPYHYIGERLGKNSRSLPFLRL